MNTASFDKLYLPEPPTPIKNALPLDIFKILQILKICMIAKSNKTKFIGFLDTELKSSR